MTVPSPARRASAVLTLAALLLAGAVTAGTAPPAEAANDRLVTLVGSLQSELGCAGDWDPACAATVLTGTDVDGRYAAELDVPAGDWEYKVALDGTWDVSYGLDGGSENIPLHLPGPATLRFTYDDVAHRVGLEVTDLRGAYSDADAGLVAAPVREEGAGEQFYFVLTDRFANGDPGNDTAGLGEDPLVSGFDPTDHGFYHGGDIAGLRERLDYIAGLGTTAIWLTPSFQNRPVQGTGENASAGYHGYWITDFTRIDPHLGTNADLEAFIDDAHARGIDVYFDIITNHTADVISYAEGTYGYVDQATQPYRTADGVPFDLGAVAGSPDFPELDAATSFPYTPVRPEGSPTLVPEWLNDVTHYHNRGNTTWEGESVTLGDFDGLDDLMTEDPAVVEGMIDIYTAWMELGIDGFRIDTVKHVNGEFWDTFTAAIAEHAGAIGNDDFFTFGEVYDADARLLSPYVRETDMDAVLDFAYQSTAAGYARGNGAAGLSGLFAADDYYTTATSSADALPTFLGNHDMGRLGHLLGDASDPLARAELAHSLMYLTRGQPVVYYGDEQGFIGTGGNDKGARQSLFATQVASYAEQPLLTGEQAGSVDRYDTDAPLYTHIAELAALRAGSPALTEGAQIELAADGGAYAFARVHRDEMVEHLVVLNNETAARTLTLTTLTPGATYTPRYGVGAPVTADATGQVSLEVGALDAVVLVADRRVAAPAAPVAPVLTPEPGSAVTALAPVAADVPDHSWAETTFAVRVVGTQDWQLLGTAEDDTPRVFHDTAGLPRGTLLEYRAVSVDAGGTVTAASTYANVGFAVNGAEPDGPGGDLVTVPGTHNTAMGCPADWAPDCEAARLTLGEHGLYTGTFDLPAGGYEYKVAVGGSWAENYGAGGVPDGANVPYTHGGGEVLFLYDPVTHYFANTAQGPVVTLPGSFGAALGCPGDWAPDCLRTWMQDPDGDGVLTFETNAIPAGTHEVKVAHGLGWEENYGVGGVRDGANYSFTVGVGQFVQFAYDQGTHVLTITVTDQPVRGVGEARAHWLAAGTVAWPRDLLPAGAEPADLTWALHTAPDGGLAVADGAVTGGDERDLTLIPGGLPAELREAYPHLADSVALDASGLDRAAVEQVLTGQLAVTQRLATGALTAFTGVQVPGVLDDLYAAEASEAPLGASWSDGSPRLTLWAPTARGVDLLLQPGGTADGEPRRIAAERAADGTWSVQGEPEWRGRAYRWDVEVYVHATDAVEHNVVTDPYSVALTVDSTHSVLVDLEDQAFAPDLWAGTPNPEAIRAVDQTIYELHVRDFSIRDETVPEDLRGTYAAFTVGDSDGMTHLRDLAEAGLTTVHLLPTFDIATIPERRADQAVPTVPDAASDSPEQQAAVMATAATDGFNWGYDPLHWSAPEGSYATDGNQDGGARVAEMRTMVGALHAEGLRVVLDQVFNHTAASGQDEQSVLDRVVPGYYHRLDATGEVETSTCCQNVATEHAMAQDLMVESVVTWARDYRVDGFRFDLMGHHSRENMEAVRAALDELTLAEDGVDGSAVHLYGEGWNFGEVANNSRFVQATQGQLGGTGIGTYSDRLRDAVHGGYGPLQQQGFGTGLYTDNNAATGAQTPAQLADLQHRTDLVRLGLAGNLAGYELLTSSGQVLRGDQIDYNGQPAGYATSPEEVITYVDKHDNQTLFDLLALRLPQDTPMADRVRMNTLALATTALAQTPTFWHAGTDLLRSKSLDRNSYDSGDHFNEIDWSMQTSVFGNGLPPERDNAAAWGVHGPLLADPALVPGPEDIELAAAMSADLLRLRSSTQLFRLGSTELITERVTFPGSGPDATPGLVVMSIDDDAGAYGVDVDPALDGVLVVMNATPEPVTEQVEELAGRDLTLSDVQAAGADDVVRSTSWDAASGTVTVPARTVAVLVDEADVPLDPALVLTPATAGPGETVTAAVTGYAPGEQVEVRLDATPVATLTADGAGAASGGLTVPASASAGDHVVAATGLASGAHAEATLTVEAEQPPSCVPLPGGVLGWVLRILVALLRALFPHLPEACWP